MKKTVISVLTGMLALSFLAGPAVAELDAAALKRQIMERSGKIKEFRALLNDPDQTVRLTALDAMMKSDDNAMRELAYGVGFNSADQAMRAVALENRIAVMTTVIVAISEPESASKTQAKAMTTWGNTYSFDIRDFNADTGQFATKGGYRDGSGQVSGTSLEFSQPHCNGRFELGDGATLKGKLSCKGPWLGDFPGTIDLR